MGEHTMEYVKEFKGGEAVYKMLDGNGKPAREVETAEWDIEMYINYCLFPLRNCINRMQALNNPDIETDEFADMLDRLYDSARAQLGRMGDALYRDMGRIEIITTNESCRGGFLHQDFIEVCVQKEPNDKAVNA
jgi:hypothetical protein